MHLTLFVPDLLWPDAENTAAFEFTGANDLARVLSLAEQTQKPLTQTDSWENRLAGLCGFDTEHAPLAALRALGDELQDNPSGNTSMNSPANARMLCADPVNLNFIQQALVLSPADAGSLTPTDTQALVDSLNDEFSGQGRFVDGSAQHNTAQWYFIAHDDTTGLPNLAACSRLAGRRVDADETRQILGRDGLIWLNRIQMCLNQHPVNAAREAQGLPAINSLWPWGLGQLDLVPPMRFSHASGQSALLTGLCRVTGIPLNQTTPSDLAGLGDQPLVVDLKPAAALSHDDTAAWQAAMTAFIADWISPAITSLSANHSPLQSLTLISVDAHFERRWSLLRSPKTLRGLRGNLWQRCLGRAPQAPALGTLARSWSV